MSLRQEIDGFLDVKRIAVAGLSTDPKHFSRILCRDLVAREYEIVPVNPKAAEIEGWRCYASVLEIVPAVQAVLIMTPPTETERVVADCTAAGIHRVWMHRGAGTGAVNPAAVQTCRDKGISVVPGECPYMFLPYTGFPHNCHGWMRKALHAELR